MRHIIDNETLTIFLEGELNSFNSDEIETHIDEVLTKGGFQDIRIDLGDLSYISSAGIRILLKIKQQYDETVLVNVPSGVFHVLQMVGFENLMRIERRKED